MNYGENPGYFLSNCHLHVSIVRSLFPIQFFDRSVLFNSKNQIENNRQTITTAMTMNAVKMNQM